MREQLGLFQSFGDGALPIAFTRSIENAERMHDYVLDRLLEDWGDFCEGRPVLENLRNVDIRPASPNQSVEEARIAYRTAKAKDAACGVYIYSAMLSTRRPVGYQMLAYPTRCRTLQDLPSEIRQIASECRFSALAFASADYINVDEFGPLDQLQF